MDERNHHLHKPTIVGEMTRDGRIVPVWKSAGLIAPEPWSPWYAGAGKTSDARRAQGDEAGEARRLAYAG